MPSKKRTDSFVHKLSSPVEIAGKSYKEIKFRAPRARDISEVRPKLKQMSDDGDLNDAFELAKLCAEVDTSVLMEEVTWEDYVEISQKMVTNFL